MAASGNEPIDNFTKSSPKYGLGVIEETDLSQENDKESSHSLASMVAAQSKETIKSNSSPSRCSDNDAVNSSPEQRRYVAPSEDPHQKAWNYLAKHDILHLFQGITANVFYRKPKDPLEDMIVQIEKLQEEDRIRKGVIKRTSTEDVLQ